MWSRALCLDYLIMPFTRVGVLLEAPVALGIGVQVIDEILWGKVQGLGCRWFPSTSNGFSLMCEEVNGELAGGLLLAPPLEADQAVVVVLDPPGSGSNHCYLWRGVCVSSF